MLTGTEMVACGVEVVAVIFLVPTHVDWVLAELPIIRLTLTSALINDLTAVTHPVAQVLVACSVVHAWIADALIHVDITVATERGIVRVVIALHHSALSRVLKHKRGSVS
jgi:hypothetical protein